MFVCVCVCVCVCVYVCVFLLFHRKGFFLLQRLSGRYLRGTDQRPFVVSIISGASAKFFNLGFQKCHISPPKTTLQQLTNWRENDMIYCTRRKDDI